MLRTSHKGFYLTHTNPTYYNSHGKFLYARNNTHVYLSVKFPISTHKAPMQLYEVTSLPVPINISSSHATQLLNMPKYFAITKHHDYYLNFTILHPFNLALLQQFFDENKLANLLGDTIFLKPINLKVPLFKIYNHSMDKVIADDHRYQLSLNKMAEAAKKDETIFKQLSEPLIDGLIFLLPGLTPMLF